MTDSVSKNVKVENDSSKLAGFEPGLSVLETFTDQFRNFFLFIGPSLRLFDSDFSGGLFRFHHDLHMV